jgi:hypothetical protein
MNHKKGNPFQKGWKRAKNLQKIFRSVKKHKKKYRKAVNGICEVILHKIEN